MDLGGTEREAKYPTGVAVVSRLVVVARGARDGDIEVGRHGTGDLGDADARLILHRDQHLVDRHGGADPIFNLCECTASFLD